MAGTLVLVLISSAALVYGLKYIMITSALYALMTYVHYTDSRYKKFKQHHKSKGRQRTKKDRNLLNSVNTFLSNFKVAPVDDKRIKVTGESTTWRRKKTHSPGAGEEVNEPAKLSTHKSGKEGPTKKSRRKRSAIKNPHVVVHSYAPVPGTNPE